MIFMTNKVSTDIVTPEFYCVNIVCEALVPPIQEPYR